MSVVDHLPLNDSFKTKLRPRLTRIKHTCNSTHYYQLYWNVYSYLSRECIELLHYIWPIYLVARLLGCLFLLLLLLLFQFPLLAIILLLTLIEFFFKDNNYLDSRHHNHNHFHHPSTIHHHFCYFSSVFIQLIHGIH